MLSVHILLPKQFDLKTFGQFENLGFVIMSTRENIRLIARAPYYEKRFLKFSPCVCLGHVDIEMV